MHGHVAQHSGAFRSIKNKILRHIKWVFVAAVCMRPNCFFVVGEGSFEIFSWHSDFKLFFIWLKQFVYQFKCTAYAFFLVTKQEVNSNLPSGVKAINNIWIKKAEARINTDQFCCRFPRQQNAGQKTYLEPWCSSAPILCINLCLRH